MSSVPKPKTVGLIISKYNSPEWFEKAMWGVVKQSLMPDEIIVADDGSEDDVWEVINRLGVSLPVRHVWQADDGFQKSKILNRAILAAQSEYLIFTDQDCVPREDFVATHVRYAERGFMLSGGCVKLPLDISLQLTKDDVLSGDAFDISWLRKNGMPMSFKCSKLVKCRLWSELLNRITTTKATWNGCNASGWRDDLIKVNGFNESMQYGGQDRELGERLRNYGVRAKQIRYSAITLHLEHERPYKTKDSIDKNKSIRSMTRKYGIVETPNGIRKLEQYCS